MPTNERTTLIAAATAALFVAYLVHAHPALLAPATVGLGTWGALYLFLRL